MELYLAFSTDEGTVSKSVLSLSGSNCSSIRAVLNSVLSLSGFIL